MPDHTDSPAALAPATRASACLPHRGGVRRFIHTDTSERNHSRPPQTGLLGTTAKSDSLFPSKPLKPWLLARFQKQAGARILRPMGRVHNCLWAPAAGKTNIGVWMSQEHQRAHYKNLQTCGSVWECPVCSAKIAERRGAELASAIAVHRARGGEVLLMTLTNSHHNRHRLAWLVAGQQKAMRSFRTGKTAASDFEAMGVVGMIRAWEVTHGTGSGWHPHFHVLVFVSAPLDDLPAWRDRLAARWLKCCRSAGLPLPDLQHGLDLQDGTYAARYAAKWGLEDEMTKGHTKKGREGRKTPFDLLGDFVETGDMEPGRLFQEFADAFKGKRQLVWSPGLKKLLAVDEATDEEIAASGDDPSYLLGLLTLEQWRKVRHSEQRGQLLQAAESGGWPAVLELVESLPVPPPDLTKQNRKNL